MPLSKLAFAAVLATALSGAAMASGIVELGAPEKAEIEVIGKPPPPKEFRPLNLGSLRTGDVPLPESLATYDERMAMRADRALDRQEELAKAREQTAAEE